MSVKVMRANLADTRSKVSLAPSDRLRLDALVLFLARVAGPRRVVVPPAHFIPISYHYRRCCAR